MGIINVVCEDKVSEEQDTRDKVQIQKENFSPFLEMGIKFVI